MAKFKYKVVEEGTDEEETMEAMSLHKLIKKLDPKKTFRIDYVNKKGNHLAVKIIHGRKEL